VDEDGEKVNGWVKRSIVRRVHRWKVRCYLRVNLPLKLPMIDQLVIDFLEILVDWYVAEMSWSELT
jgi:hypothetical protein